MFVQIRQRNKKAQNQVMCTARPSWRSMTIADMVYKNCMFNVDVHLDGIISIDGKAQVNDNNVLLHNTQYELKYHLKLYKPIFSQHTPLISNRYNIALVFTDNYSGTGHYYGQINSDLDPVRLDGSCSLRHEGFNYW